MFTTALITAHHTHNILTILILHDAVAVSGGGAWHGWCGGGGCAVDLRVHLPGVTWFTCPCSWVRNHQSHITSDCLQQWLSQQGLTSADVVARVNNHCALTLLTLLTLFLTPVVSSAQLCGLHQTGSAISLSLCYSYHCHQPGPDYIGDNNIIVKFVKTRNQKNSKLRSRPIQQACLVIGPHPTHSHLCLWWSCAGNLWTLLSWRTASHNNISQFLWRITRFIAIITHQQPTGWMEKDTNIVVQWYHWCCHLLVVMMLSDTGGSGPSSAGQSSPVEASRAGRMVINHSELLKIMMTQLF